MIHIRSEFACANHILPRHNVLAVKSTESDKFFSGGSVKIVSRPDDSFFYHFHLIPAYCAPERTCSIIFVLFCIGEEMTSRGRTSIGGWKEPEPKVI